jgi:hypothetical protein
MSDNRYRDKGIRAVRRDRIEQRETLATTAAVAARTAIAATPALSRATKPNVLPITAAVAAKLLLRHDGIKLVAAIRSSAGERLGRVHGRPM